MNVNGSSPNASVTVDAVVNFGASQTLADLTISNGAVVSVGLPAPAPAPFGAGEMDAGFAAPLPGPCAAALLSGGLAMLLGLRRRDRGTAD